MKTLEQLDKELDNIISPTSDKFDRPECLKKTCYCGVDYYDGKVRGKQCEYCLRIKKDFDWLNFSLNVWLLLSFFFWLTIFILVILIIVKL